MFNFDPASMFDPEKLQEEAIPTYEEWLETAAKVLDAHPALTIGRGVFKGIRYLKAREDAFISVLHSKGLWGNEDSELLEARTVECASSYNKELVKMIVQQVATGNLTINSAAGTPITLTPDSAIAALNEFVLNDDKLSGRSVEILANLLGESEADVKKRYETAVEGLKTLNKARAMVKDAVEAGGDLFAEGGLLSGLGGIGGFPGGFNPKGDQSADPEVETPEA